MSTYSGLSPEQQAAAYERYISENWDSLPEFERDMARSYLEAKAQAAIAAGVSIQSPPVSATGGQFTADQSFPVYAYSSHSYGTDAFADFGQLRKEEDPGAWAVPVGYIALFIFPPLTLVCSIKNFFDDRPIHGFAQLFLLMAVPALFLMTGFGLAPDVLVP